MSKIIPTLGKAVFGGLVAFLGSLAVVLQGDMQLADVTDGQWLTAILAGLTVAAGVWGIPYRRLEP